MTTMPDMVLAVRRILNDRPERIQLGAAISSLTASTYTVAAADIGKVGMGNILDHDDGDTGAEQVRVKSTDPANNQFSAERGFGGSEAAEHADSSYMLLNPRFYFDTVAQAVNTVLDADLFNAGVLDLQEHTVTSSTSTTAYSAPTSTCEEFLSVAQMTSTMVAPEWLRDFTRLPRNVDSSLFTYGKVFFIYSNLGIPGTDDYYVTCAHKHTITTLTSRAERIVQWLACAYLLEWTGPRRVAGPTNQGDRTVRPGQEIATGSYFRALADKAIANERSDVRKLNPPQKRYVRQ